jgi:Ni,Fe-hydrogenase III large subunit
MTRTITRGRRTDAGAWRRAVSDALSGGARFAGLYATEAPGGTEAVAVMVGRELVETISCLAEPAGDGVAHVPSLVPVAPAAFWYERAAHDLSGVVADGHPRLDPLLLPLPAGAPRPLPGGAEASTEWDRPEPRGPMDVTGEVFSLAWGPVRSGVSESIEFLLETPGEDIPHLNIRPHFKHRGIAKQFEGRDIADGLLVAERVEGVATVAHALAYCHAVESLAGVDVPRRAGLVRVVHAELERIANHLDVTMKLADAAGLVVATARFGAHKEAVLRLVSRLTGSRFARGLVVPGGVRPGPATPDQLTLAELVRLQAAIGSDIAALESSPSFLDRLRTTGVLSTTRAARFAALGPIGRGSGVDDDGRRVRPTDAYADLPAIERARFDSGDALARARVRWHEIDTSVALIQAAVHELAGTVDRPWAVPLPPVEGTGIGWAEGPHGEVLYVIHIDAGRIRRCFARSPALHNLVLLHDVIHTDIFTDLPFIEASFGLSYAGVAM